MIVCVTVLALTAVTQAQDPQQPIFRTGVAIVRVDVSVTGRDDEAVADLQPSDFEIREDGVEQRVDSAQFVRIDGTRTSNTDESLEIRSTEHAELEAAREDVRIFAIFLDDYHVEKAPQITLRVRKALKEFVRQFGPNDLVAVMTPLTPLTHLRFTRSREDLLAQMEDFEGRRHQVFPAKSALEEAQLASRNVWEIRGGVTLSALEALVTYLGGLREGRKSVLFVSQGPTMSRVDAANEDRLQRVLQAANRGNVTVHAFDPRPLGSVQVGGADVISRLTAETGGRAVVNSNEPGERLAQTIADASAYYLLGYTPTRTMSDDGKFHRIEVRVRRRGVRVLSRRGYWAPSDAEANPKPTSAMGEPGAAEAIAELDDTPDQRVADVWIGASPGEGGLTRVSFTWEPVVRSGSDKVTAVEIEAVDHVPGQAIASNALATMDLAPSERVQLRFTARASDGEIVDRWTLPFTPPRLIGAALALGTPRFLRARSAFEARAMEAGTDPIPAASRRFRTSDKVTVDLECYTSGGITPAVTAWLLNGKGEPRLELQVLTPAAGGSRFALPLSSLAPGVYVVRIDVRAGAETARQQIAFRIAP